MTQAVKLHSVWDTITGKHLLAYHNATCTLYINKYIGFVPEARFYIMYSEDKTSASMLACCIQYIYKTRKSSITHAHCEI